MMILHSNTRNDEAAIQYQSSISMGPDQVQNSGAPAEDSAAYYNSGSKEAAEETPLTLERLEPRRKLTKNSTRLVIILVGLPARGKSFVARKLQNFITWNGHHCKIFNVGKYRRQAYAERTETTGACDANFFDSKNAEAAALRENVAEIALQDMLRWLDDDDSDSEHGENAKKASDLDSNRRDVTSVSTLIDDVPRAQRIAIFDATNSTKKRRQWVLEQCSSPQLRPGKPTGCVFVESVCDDAELLLEVSLL
jgi:6-phosphofructo-2-kinase/fructose-2,6-biphosphatase 2